MQICQKTPKGYEDNNIISSHHWKKYRKDNNLEEQGYVSNPWQFFGKSAKEFFKDIYSKKVYKTKKEHANFIKENNLTSTYHWMKYRKDNNIKEQGYYMSPWISFNKSAKQFFAEIRKQINK